jgi:hypothetical protein
MREESDKPPKPVMGPSGPVPEAGSPRRFLGSRRSVLLASVIVITALIAVSALVVQASAESLVGSKAYDVVLTDDDMPTGWTADTMNGAMSYAVRR